MYPFEACTTIAVSGTTGSGKTTWVYELLKHRDQMFDGEPPVRILYCYGIHQPLYEEMQKFIPSMTFKEGLPTPEDVDELTSDRKHSILLIDDLMEQAVKSSEVELLFTRGSHHRRMTVIYINQNQFNQGKNARSINLNTHYLILLRNPRDVFQIQILGKQVFPGKSQSVVEAYKDCTSQPYGYLVLDLSPHTSEEHRLRTKIFPGERTIVYLPY